MTHSVVVQDLRLQRGAFALGPVSFAVPAGGRLAVVGPSGSGKTSLLRCLAGLERPDTGTVTIGDRLVAGPGVNVPPDRRGVGLVFQDGALWSHQTALQHLRFAAPGLSADAARALLDRAGLGHLAARKPGAMSGGEAQRLGLVRALAPEPSVLLLDEPLRSVDVHQRDGLVLLVRELADERHLTTILVTHDRDEALALATDLVVLHQGHLVEQGPALQLLQAPQTAFTAAFLAGAACLPTTPGAAGAVQTPFGPFPRPAAAGDANDLRLVLLPGDAAVAATAGPGTAPARALASLPGPNGFVVKAALGDQLVQAHADTPVAPGAALSLVLQRSPRLLPWDRGSMPSPVEARP